MTAPGRRPQNAVEGILDAAARRVIGHGAVETSLSDIAAEAGVSKALIHYHFHDKDALLARLVVRTADGLLARERAALEGQDSPLAVDALWDWLAAELERGSVRLLLELALHRSPAVREASDRAAAARRESGAATIARLFTLLSLRPRVPVELLAGVTVTFIDGLALQRDGADTARIAFDVFWLAMLNLAE